MQGRRILTTDYNCADSPIQLCKPHKLGTPPLRHTWCKAVAMLCRAAGLLRVAPSSLMKIII